MESADQARNFLFQVTNPDYNPNPSIRFVREPRENYNHNNYRYWVKKKFFPQKNSASIN